VVIGLARDRRAACEQASVGTGPLSANGGPDRGPDDHRWCHRTTYADDRLGRLVGETGLTTAKT
jgi:hypothetical protein